MAVLTTIAAEAFCPGCVPTVKETYAEMVARSDVVLLAQWADAKPLDRDNPAYTEFEIAVVGKQRFTGNDAEGKEGKASASATFKPKQRLRLAQYRTANPGDLYLLMGTRSTAGTIDWESPVEITETGYYYVMQAPSPELPKSKRLAYYLKFLETSNKFIADDAYNEFALAAFDDVIPLIDKLPLDKIRKWLADPKTPRTHLGLYGILLGLAGKPKDADLLKSAFIDKRNEYSLGVEGIITGYLLLRGGDGVTTLEKEILHKRDAGADVVYPVLQALDLVWTYGRDRVPEADLIHAMRTLLDNPTVRDFAVFSLSRWKDWTSTSRLIEMYEAGGPDTGNLRRNIIAFMLNAARATTDVDGTPQPVPQAKLAKEFLDKIRAQDPEAIEKVEQFFKPRPNRSRKANGR